MPAARAECDCTHGQLRHNVSFVECLLSGLSGYSIAKALQELNCVLKSGAVYNAAHDLVLFVTHRVSHELCYPLLLSYAPQRE